MLPRKLAQAIRTQAVAAIPGRHRQAEGFVGAPAWAGRAAGKIRAAIFAGEAARAVDFRAICHEGRRILTWN
jgi:hypothetical protein